MRVIDSPKALSEIRRAWKREEKSIGFIPTMGQLHEGHISLLDQARKDCDQLVCSVFVNPFQFNDQRDFSNYPRDLASDQRKAKSAGCDLFFCPSVEDIYPRQPLIHIDFGPITREMEGKYRPGHFNGVAIVLSKLFHMVGLVSLISEKKTGNSASLQRDSQRTSLLG